MRDPIHRRSTTHQAAEDDAVAVARADRSQAVLDRLHEVVFQTDAAGNWTYLNRAWTNILGFGVPETLGTNFLEYVHPDEREATVAMFMAVVSGGAPYCHHETRYRTVDGGYRWMELRAHLEYDAAGHVVGNTGTLIDVSERHEADMLQRDQAHVLELIALGAPISDSLTAVAALAASRTGATVAISMLDADLSTARPGAAGGDGRGNGSHPHAPQEPLRLVAIARASTAPASAYSLEEGRPLLAEAAGEGTHRLTVPILSSGGRGTVGELTLRHDRPLSLDERGMALVHRCTQLASIAIQRRLDEEHARRQSLHDPLTGLANRVLVEDRLHQALAGARRAGEGVAVLLFDLNRFKDVNDSLGHEAGDAALRHVAARTTARLRATDTAARLGGDEFAVILPAVATTEYAEAVARKLVEAVHEPLALGGIVLRLQASVGVAVFPAHGEDLATLFRRADVAMYRAKRLGTGHAVYDADEDEDQFVQIELASELRRAIEERALALVYQPKVDLRTGAIVGLEALVRWEHPTRGPVAPDYFVSLAERTGSIRALSNLVLRTALAESLSWSAAGFPLGVAVNLSAHDLHDPELPAVIAEAMRETGTDGAALDLEITESAVMANPEAAIAMIHELAALGVGCAIDDFGTGHSSLAYLKRLPARWLKIDRSFVRDMADDPRDQSIVRSAIDLAHTMGMAVVGEGVETPAVCAMLDDFGCDQAQGYVLARPMTAPVLVEWLRAHPQGVPCGTVG